jgi:hypothetical protein
MSDQKKSLDQIRKERNLEILRKMKAGESLSSFDSHSSWFPNRPKIEKDPNAIKVLYGTNEIKEASPSNGPNLVNASPLDGCPVVQLGVRRAKLGATKLEDN